MSNDYEIFEGKTLSDVFKDIYDNSKTKEGHQIQEMSSVYQKQKNNN
jgi:hypothetical protein